MSGPFIPADGRSGDGREFWEPLILSGDELRTEIDRLAAGPLPASGARESLIVHPSAVEPGPGLTPGIEVRLSVLLPGEETKPRRHNATEINFCIAGSGSTDVLGKTLRFGQYDVWNHPSWASYRHRNDGDTVQARITYSNAALLEKLHVHLWDDDPPDPLEVPRPATEADDTRSDGGGGAFPLGDDGAWLMPYEKLISPPPVASDALHWPWDAVKQELDRLAALGSDYSGRRLYLLYNPMTGRTHGITPSFFATMTVRPGGIVDRPHRHVSAAINYYFSGSGWSRVAGKKYAWKAGDLMLSAPGWAIHHHASDEGDPVYELTVQDQPFHIANESLLWQEDLKAPPRLLGVEAGFATNRSETGA